MERGKGNPEKAESMYADDLLKRVDGFDAMDEKAKDLQFSMRKKEADLTKRFDNKVIRIGDSVEMAGKRDTGQISEPETEALETEKIEETTEESEELIKSEIGKTISERLDQLVKEQNEEIENRGGLRKVWDKYRSNTFIRQSTGLAVAISASLMPGATIAAFLARSAVATVGGGAAGGAYGLSKYEGKTLGQFAEFQKIEKAGNMSYDLEKVKEKIKELSSEDIIKIVSELTAIASTKGLKINSELAASEQKEMNDWSEKNKTLSNIRSKWRQAPLLKKLAMVAGVTVLGVGTSVGLTYAGVGAAAAITTSAAVQFMFGFLTAQKTHQEAYSQSELVDCLMSEVVERDDLGPDDIEKISGGLEQARYDVNRYVYKTTVLGGALFGSIATLIGSARLHSASEHPQGQPEIDRSEGQPDVERPAEHYGEPDQDTAKPGVEPDGGVGAHKDEQDIDVRVDERPSGGIGTHDARGEESMQPSDTGATETKTDMGESTTDEAPRPAEVRAEAEAGSSNLKEELVTEADKNAVTSPHGGEKMVDHMIEGLRGKNQLDQISDNEVSKLHDEMVAKMKLDGILDKDGAVVDYDKFREQFNPESYTNSVVEHMESGQGSFVDQLLGAKDIDQATPVAESTTVGTYFAPEQQDQVLKDGGFIPTAEKDLGNPKFYLNENQTKEILDPKNGYLGESVINAIKRVTGADPEKLTYAIDAEKGGQDQIKFMVGDRPVGHELLKHYEGLDASQQKSGGFIGEWFNRIFHPETNPTETGEVTVDNTSTVEQRTADQANQAVSASEPPASQTEVVPETSASPSGAGRQIDVMLNPDDKTDLPPALEKMFDKGATIQDYQHGVYKIGNPDSTVSFVGELDTKSSAFETARTSYLNSHNLSYEEPPAAYIPDGETESRLDSWKNYVDNRLVGQEILKDKYEGNQ